MLIAVEDDAFRQRSRVSLSYHLRIRPSYLVEWKHKTNDENELIELKLKSWKWLWRRNNSDFIICSTLPPMVSQANLLDFLMRIISANTWRLVLEGIPPTDDNLPAISLDLQHHPLYRTHFHFVVINRTIKNHDIIDFSRCSHLWCDGDDGERNFIWFFIRPDFVLPRFSSCCCSHNFPTISESVIKKNLLSLCHLSASTLYRWALFYKLAMWPNFANVSRSKIVDSLIHSLAMSHCNWAHGAIVLKIKHSVIDPRAKDAIKMLMPIVLISVLIYSSHRQFFTIRPVKRNRQHSIRRSGTSV